jgi:hypothetical protein
MGGINNDPNGISRPVTRFTVDASRDEQNIGAKMILK